MTPQDSIENPVGWQCTGYTHGCFCPTCDQRDIARAEWLADASRCESLGDDAGEAEARGHG